MENSQELIGVLQAISIDREVRAYESAGEGTRGRRKMKKGK